MSSFEKIEGYSQLVRDRSSGSVLSIDKHGFEQFRAKKMERRAQAEKMAELESEIENLKMLVAGLVARSQSK